MPLGELQKRNSGCYFILFIFQCLFLRQCERQSASGRRAEGDTESEAGSRLRGVSTEHHRGLKLMTCEVMTHEIITPEIMIQAEVGGLTHWATEVPQQDVSLKEILATCVLQMRSLRPKEINCLPIGVLRKKESSEVIANQFQENKFESKTKLIPEGNCQNY